MAAKTSDNSPHHVGNPSLRFTKDDAGRMTIPPKNLNIVWGRDSRYWSLPKDDRSPAVLNQVYWLEVAGCVDGIQPDKQYEVGFHVSLTPDAFGFGGSPLYVMVKRGKEGKFGWSKTQLDNQNEQDIKGKPKKADQSQGQDQSEDQKLYFGLYEVWSGKWKGGLRIHHVFIQELPGTN